LGSCWLSRVCGHCKEGAGVRCGVAASLFLSPPPPCRICMWAWICLWLLVWFGMRPSRPRGGGQVLLQSSEWNQITGPSVTSSGRRQREEGGREPGRERGGGEACRDKPAPPSPEDAVGGASHATATEDEDTGHWQDATLGGTAVIQAWPMSLWN
jgi:hypothetical protein